jgi:hypothetical protein
MPDRYLRIVLTVIALELFWIGVKDFATPASAQASVPAQAPAAQAPAAPQAQPAAPTPTPQPLPVVITGINLDPAGLNERSLLPIYSARTLKVDSDRPIPVVGAGPFTVQTDKPLPIRADRPIQVESVPYKPGRTPGE